MVMRSDPKFVSSYVTSGVVAAIAAVAVNFYCCCKYSSLKACSFIAVLLQYSRQIATGAKIDKRYSNFLHTCQEEIVPTRCIQPTIKLSEKGGQMADHLAAFYWVELSVNG
jgi:hypothetical protein